MNTKQRLFDFAIRPRNQSPPLAQLFVVGGRLSSTVCFHTILILAFILYFYRHWSFLVSMGAFSVCAHGMLVVDGLVSNSFGRNIENLRRAGYDDRCVLFMMEVNLFGAQLLSYILVNYVVIDPEVYSFKYLLDHFGVELMAQVAANLILAQAAFLLGHMLVHMHPRLMKLHIFHHCSTHSSWNTNVMFHPVDVCIEFGVPALFAGGNALFLCGRIRLVCSSPTVCFNCGTPTTTTNTCGCPMSSTIRIATPTMPSTRNYGYRRRETSSRRT